MGDQAKAVTDTKDQVKEKITVDGKEIKLTKEELIELAQKGQDYTNKTKALADEKESLKDRSKKIEAWEAIGTEMDSNPKLKEALNKTYSDVKAGKISKVEGDTRSLKMVDKWIDKAENIEDREAYKELRQAIKEETNVEELEKEMKEMKEEISLLKSTSTIGLTNKVEQDLQKLEDELGKDFLDKYRTDVKALAIKFPNQTVKKLLYHMADDNALEDALVARADKRKKLELDRKKKGSSTGGDDTVIPKSEYTYDKAGKVTVESLVQRVKERLGKT